MKPRPLVVVFVFVSGLLFLSGYANEVSLRSGILKSNAEADIIQDCHVLNECVYNKKKLQRKIIPNCYCDGLCFLYNDCCYDNPIHKNEKYALDQIEKINRTVCLPMSTTKYGSEVYEGVRAVDTCDPDLSTSSNACESHRINTIADLLLVTGNDGVTYKNEHCAMCNGIRNFERWTLGVSLERCPYGRLREIEEYKNDSVLNITFNLYNKGCQFLQFPSDKYPPRYCLRTGFLELEHWTYATVTCLDKTQPIFNSVDLFGSMSCCVENFPFPEECPYFKCYESKEKVVTKSKAIGTKSMMVFFEFRPSKVSFYCPNISISSI